MRTRVTKPSLAAVLVLVLATTALISASPAVQALTLDTTNKVALTGSTVNANVTVGVKAGDWMEYNVTYMGASDPPQEFPNWFRFRITDVQDTNITAEMTFEALDGQISTHSNTYDLKIGVLNLLVVPAGLTYADIFYHQDHGNITIAGTESATYAGITRVAFYAIFDEKEVNWDKATGIFLQSEQVLNETDVAQKVTLSATSLWYDPSTAPDNSELDQMVFYAKVIVVIAVVAIIAFLLLRTLKKRGK
ncbi:MAG: hypothetical protein CW716_06235 [Candidatus Bathyarchaeum sp.]|nr:MAG: hypothetical protein CW716_06235 [Candidatus Bathyarchaeum sp.]